jgi:hypothetical protein
MLKETRDKREKRGTEWRKQEEESEKKERENVTTKEGHRLICKSRKDTARLG